MLHFSRFKIIMIAMVCAFGLIAALPNLLSKETLASFPNFLPNQQISLGLDLKGGAHLLLQMDENELKTDWLGTLRGDVRKQLRDGRIGFTSIGVTENNVRVKLAKPEQMDDALRRVRQLVQPIGNALLGTSGDDIDVEQSGADEIIVTPTDQGMLQRTSNAASAAIETVRKRIDPGGTTEASIVRQGRDRILVQKPGEEDTRRLKELIGKTAKLTFHDVHPQMTGLEACETRVPIGYKVFREDRPGLTQEQIDALPENPCRDQQVDGQAGDPRATHMLLRATPVVQGEDLTDAQPGFDSRTNEPIVTFRFNQSGARRFGRFTKENVGRPFAIVLDNAVLSAPVIREAILGGSGQISGNFTVEGANTLAIQLRSGALPTTLTIIEERTVGATLGEDSIEAGKWAAVVGGLLVAGFMIFAYGLFGCFALVAVFVNLLLIVGAMSLIGSTLTLPGIAGLVLTVGMAVDANVLIFERIREELRNGKTTIAAIDSGFSRALGTILDSNLTTLIAGLVMFTLGAGPIRGFAVTLSLGILSSVFTAFMVTRLLVSFWLSRQPSRKIPAPV